jgi:hypothetical protein
MTLSTGRHMPSNNGLRAIESPYEDLARNLGGPQTTAYYLALRPSIGTISTMAPTSDSAWC